MRTVSLMQANQEFSKLIKEVEKGQDFVITRRGRPIAKLVPHRVDKRADPKWRAAYERMVKLMDEGVHLGGERVTREEIYQERVDRYKGGR
jgi:prevent-host-death family protein